MQSAVRFIGLLNAAVWLGAMVFFTFVAGPTLFSAEARRLLVAPHLPGAIAQMLVGHYMVLQEVCAAIALAHLVFEWFLSGRLFPKTSLFVLVGLLAVASMGSRLLVPKMREMFLVKYAVQTTPQQKEAAARSFSILHGASQVANLLALGGVLFYYWRLSMGNQGGRSSSGMRFRA